MKAELDSARASIAENRRLIEELGSSHEKTAAVEAKIDESKLDAMKEEIMQSITNVSNN